MAYLFIFFGLGGSPPEPQADTSDCTATLLLLRCLRHNPATSTKYIRAKQRALLLHVVVWNGQTVMASTVPMADRAS
jgi:hypothetical protein